MLNLRIAKARFETPILGTVTFFNCHSIHLVNVLYIPSMDLY